jgi:ribonuclease VapC
VILDSSALVAVLLEEVGRDALLRAMEEADLVGIGAPTLVEASIVLAARMGPPGVTVLHRLVTDGDIAVIPFGDAHRRAAVDAFLRFGKGRHPARLNLGDCHSYATARVARQPLLCVGDDFGQTDLELVPLGAV